MDLLLQFICANCQYVQRGYDSSGLGEATLGLTVTITLPADEYYCERCHSMNWRVEAKLVKHKEVPDPQTQIVGREEFYANWQQTLDRMERQAQASKASEGE